MDLANEDIVTITQNVLVTMLEIDVLAGEPHPETERSDRITGCVQISGAWQGAVVLQTSLGLATRVGCQMLNIWPDDVTPADVQDALAEITNMIGGNIKSLVPGPSFLSLPSVTMGQDFDFRVFGVRLVSDVPMTADAEPIRVMVCERDLNYKSKSVARSCGWGVSLLKSQS